MNVNHTRKIFAALAVLLLLSRVSFALNGIQYNLTAGTATFNSIGAPAAITAPSSATTGTVIAGGVDDQLVGPFSPTGFAINYGGVRYTSFRVSSNGFIAFNNPGTSLPTNNLTTGPRTVVAPLWDDLATAGAGRVAYFSTTSAS